MNKRIDEIGIFLQFVLLAAVIISFLTSIFIGPLLVVTYSLMALILFVLSYNNYTIYKRKYMTLLYFICGVLLTVLTLVRYFNGI